MAAAAALYQPKFVHFLLFFTRYCHMLFGNFLRNWERKNKCIPFPIRRKRKKKNRTADENSRAKASLSLSLFSPGAVWPQTLGRSALPDLSWYKTSRLQQECAQLWGGSGAVPGICAIRKNHPGQPCWIMASTGAAPLAVPSWEFSTAWHTAVGGTGRRNSWFSSGKPHWTHSIQKHLRISCTTVGCCNEGSTKGPKSQLY